MNRAQDQNAAAKLLLFEYESDLAETKKSRLDQFVHDASRQPKERLELAGRKTVDVLDRMEEIFLPRDILLSSAGQVPIFYWLVRSHREADDQFIREFLVKFERQRRDNRNLVESNPLDKTIDRQLLEYDQFNRNTNDLVSHKGRIKILEERFESFLRVESKHAKVER